MNILVFGAGVIGTAYAWQLSEAGNKVTLLIRENKLKAIKENGIHIRYSDYRNNRENFRDIIYKPSVVTDFSKEDNYDLIIVSVKSTQLDKVLQQIKTKVANSDVLIFESFFEDTNKIEKYLSPSQYIFGFPHIMGGGTDENGIYCTIFGNKTAPTMLGEKDGKITERIKCIAKVMGDANLNPEVSTEILSWILTHYAEAAGLLGGVMKAGSGKKFAENTKIMKHTILAIREGLNVCKARGIDVSKINPQNKYYWPLFILVPFFKKMYSADGAQLMIKGHISHATDEMKAMFYDVLKSGKKYNVDMPYFSELKEYVDKFTVK
jgi:2-dehydropantoate 2-reductase